MNMNISSEYIPVELYLLKFIKNIENMPEIEIERLEKKCGSASLKMINNGSTRAEWLNGSAIVRQNFEISYRTLGNDSASRAKALGLLEQLAGIFEKTTDINLGDKNIFIRIFRTDSPALSVRCTGGEEEYSQIYQLVYIETN